MLAEVLNNAARGDGHRRCRPKRSCLFWRATRRPCGLWRLAVGRKEAVVAVGLGWERARDG